MRPVDYAGRRFDRLVATRPGEPRGGRRTWVCICDCGATAVVSGNSLQRGRTRSCGCAHREQARINGRLTRGPITHGKSKTPEYFVWKTMKARAGSPSNAKDAELYQGVAVCSRWASSFEAFIADMGPRPTKSHSIERKNNSGNYEPGNCIWATPKEQANNRRKRRTTAMVAEARAAFERGE